MVLALARLVRSGLLHYTFHMRLCSAIICQRNTLQKLSTTCIYMDKNEVNEKLKNKKKQESFIMLYGIDGSLTRMKLDDAAKLANRRGMKIIQVSDSDMKKQVVYKLVAGAEHLKDDIQIKKEKDRKDSKTEKIISVSSKITEHDLMSKVNNMIKWLEKSYEIRITITGFGENDEFLERTFSKMESKISPYGRLLQKRRSGTNIKCHLISLKK